MAKVITLNKFRQGCDVALTLRLFVSGTVVDWSTARHIVVALMSDTQGVVTGRFGTTVDTSDPTLLHATYPACRPMMLGQNRIIITFTDASGYTATIDQVAFEAVATTDELDGDYAPTQEQIAIYVDKVSTEWHVGSGGDLNVIESISVGGVVLPVVDKDVALPLSDTEHPGLVTMDEGITEGSDKPAPSGAVAQLRTQIQSAMQQLSSAVAGKQDKLVSGDNIKTLNGESLLGGGNVQLPDTRVSVTESAPGGASVEQLTRTPIGTASRTIIIISRVAASGNTGVIMGAYIETADGEETEVLREVLPNKGYVDGQLEGKEAESNKVTSLSAQSTDEQYPSAKCVYDLIGDVETLINAL